MSISTGTFKRLLRQHLLPSVAPKPNFFCRHRHYLPHLDPSVLGSISSQLQLTQHSAHLERLQKLGTNSIQPGCKVSNPLHGSFPVEMQKLPFFRRQRHGVYLVTPFLLAVHTFSSSAFPLGYLTNEPVTSESDSADPPKHGLHGGLSLSGFRRGIASPCLPRRRCSFILRCLLRILALPTKHSPGNDFDASRLLL